MHESSTHKLAPAANSRLGTLRAAAKHRRGVVERLWGASFRVSQTHPALQRTASPLENVRLLEAE